MASKSDRIELTIRLPKELAERAEAAGLLTNERFEQMLVDELARLQHVNRFANTVEKLRSLEPQITQEEIDAELEAYRHETRDQGTQE